MSRKVLVSVENKIFLAMNNSIDSCWCILWLLAVCDLFYLHRRSAGYWLHLWFSVDNKLSLFCEQRGILYPHIVLQTCYCLGLILMKLRISNVSSPNDTFGAFTKWDLMAFVCSFVWSFRMYGSSVYTPSMSSWQTTKCHGIVATINCFLFGIFTVRPSTGRLKNVSFIPSGQMAVYFLKQSHDRFLPRSWQGIIR